MKHFTDALWWLMQHRDSGWSAQVDVTPPGPREQLATTWMNQWSEAVFVSVLWMLKLLLSSEWEVINHHCDPHNSQWCGLANGKLAALRSVSASSHYLIQQVQRRTITSAAHFTQNNGGVCTPVHVLHKANKRIYAIVWAYCNGKIQFLLM